MHTCDEEGTGEGWAADDAEQRAAASTEPMLLDDAWADELPVQRSRPPSSTGGRKGKGKGKDKDNSATLPIEAGARVRIADGPWAGREGAITRVGTDLAGVRLDASGEGRNRGRVVDVGIPSLLLAERALAGAAVAAAPGSGVRGRHR